jgi:hypothetical protein
LDVGIPAVLSDPSPLLAVSVHSSPDVTPEPVSAPGRQRASSIAVLQDVLAGSTEGAVAAQLHISIRTLRRYAEGSVRMNWVTHTRLQRMAAELETKRAAEHEVIQRSRPQPGRKRERTVETYPLAASPAVALT